MVSVRRAQDCDLERLIDFEPDVGLRALDPARLRRDAEEGRLRASWSWLVKEDGELVGRALWWGKPGAALPGALEALDLSHSVQDRADLAVQVLAAAQTVFAAQGASKPMEYTMNLARGWRQDAAAVVAVDWRRQACRSSGLSIELERLQYAWTPECGVPAASTYLAYRPGGDEEFLDLFARVAKGSLDAQTQRSIQEMGPAAQARDDLDFYLSCPGEREWWRVAVDREGDAVGFAIPSATPYHRNVGYLGVLPERRGRGMVDDLLGEITRIHADAGATMITATTDTTNAPMAAAFERAGYPITEVRLVLSAP